MSDNSYQPKRLFTHQSRGHDDGYTSNNSRSETTFDYRNSQNYRPYHPRNMNPSQHCPNSRGENTFYYRKGQIFRKPNHARNMNPSQYRTINGSPRQGNNRWNSHTTKPYSRSRNFNLPTNSNFEMNSTCNNDFNQYHQNVPSRRDNRSSGEKDSRRNHAETARRCSSEIDSIVFMDSSQLEACNPSRRHNRPHFSNFESSYEEDTSRNSGQNKFQQRINFSKNHFKNEAYSRTKCDTHYLKSDERNHDLNSKRESNDTDSVADPGVKDANDMGSISSDSDFEEKYECSKSDERNHDLNSNDMDSVADYGVKDADDMGSISSDSEFEEKYECSRDSGNEDKDEVLRDKNEQTEGSELHQFKRSFSDWYHVKIFPASQLPFKEALELISGYLQPLIFGYYDFKHIRILDEFSFLICDFEVAEKLFNSKGKIEIDNKQLRILVNSASPQFIPNRKMPKAIRSALAHRYDPINNSLDLSMFFDDRYLFEADCFVPLDRSDALKYVFDIIGSTLPNLKSINLNSNKLYLRDHLTIVTNSVPQLKAISLKNNKFKSVADLKSLEKLQLTELTLTDNPFCSNTSDVTDMFKMFPTMYSKTTQSEQFKLTSCETILPPEELVFVCTQKAKSFVGVFFEDYFSVYDSSRLDLARSYHDNAQFSLVAVDGVGKNRAISELIKVSRNLLRDSDHRKKEALLIQGKTNVLKFLNCLPLTKHDTSSFTCDCPILNDNMIHVTVTGLYEQLPPVTLDKKIIVYFNRAFVLIRDSEGNIKISNDQLFVTNRTQQQYISAFTSINGLDSRFCENEVEGNQIKKLSLQSGLGLRMCQYYLEEAEFDYDQALDNLKRELDEDSDSRD